MQPGDVEVFRLSVAAYRRSLVAAVPAIVVGLLGAVAAVAKLSGQARWVSLVVCLAVILAVASYRLRYSRRANMQVTAGSVLVTGALRTRKISRDQLALAVRVEELSAPQTPVPSVAVVYVLDHEGRRALRMYDGVWGRPAVMRIVDLLGLPTTHVQRATYDELAKRYPGAAPWAVAHPHRLASITVIAVIVIVIIVVVLSS